jgi:hypothetical protein
MEQGLEGQTRAQRQGKFTDNFIILVIAHIIHSLFLQSSTLSFSSFVENEFSFKLCASEWRCHAPELLWEPSHYLEQDYSTSFIIQHRVLNDSPIPVDKQEML